MGQEPHGCEGPEREEDCRVAGLHHEARPWEVAVIATVVQLLDRASKLTGLRTTGTERELALQALQDAYSRAVMDAECSLATVSYTFVAASDDYSLTTMLAEQPTRLYQLSLVNSGVTTPLQQVSYQELLEMRDGVDANGSPTYYATIGFERVAFYPNPDVGDVLRTWYMDPVPTLVESAVGIGAGEEITPSKLPANFHWAILLPAMVLEMLDKEQRLAESGMWNERYERGIARLQEHIGQMGGQANRAWKAF